VVPLAKEVTECPRQVCICIWTSLGQGHIHNWVKVKVTAATKVTQAYWDTGSVSTQRRSCLRNDLW